MKDSKPIPLREQTNVAIIGFSSLVREGIGRTLSGSEFKIYHSYETAKEAADSLATDTLGVAIVDLESAHDPFHDIAVLHIRAPSTRIVLLAKKFDFAQMVAAFKSGAHAYLMKEIDPHSLIHSLRLAAHGERVFPSELLQHLPDSQVAYKGKAQAQFQSGGLLSARETDALRYLAMGYPNKVVACRLGISEATVKVYVKTILRKLAVQNRTQAAVWAVSQGLVAPAEHVKTYVDHKPNGNLTELSMQAKWLMDSYAGTSCGVVEVQRPSLTLPRLVTAFQPSAPEPVRTPS